jgi:hypothetical protein
MCLSTDRKSKEMGIQLGESFFEVKDKLEANKVALQQ